jgi:hypothetical protein
MANTFEGYGLGNPNFQSGLDGRWEFPVAAERPYAYARTDWAPTGLNGFYTWSDGTGQTYFTSSEATNPSTVTLNSGAIANNVATLTFSAGPAIATGDEIRVTNLGTSFNGTYTVSGATGNNVTYAKTAEDTTVSTPSRLASVTVVNSVTETTPTSTAVTSLSIASPDDSYNVPGNIGYNADNPIDNIIQANENPDAE